MGFMIRNGVTYGARKYASEVSTVDKNGLLGTSNANSDAQTIINKISDLLMSQAGSISTIIQEGAYDDTELRSRITTAESSIATIIEEGAYDDTELRSRITTAESSIATIIEEGAYDDTEVRSQITSLSSAITTLNGDAQTDGSMRKQVADAIAAVIASAPTSLDTLKEIADWIAGHASDAAEMNTAIQSNAANISTIFTSVNEIYSHSFLPVVSAADAGKILMVDENGNWVASAIYRAEEITFHKAEEEEF